MQVEVQTYSGYRADERPTGFVLNGRRYQVEEVCDQWLGPETAYFKVRGNDQNLYILEHDRLADEWRLASFRSQSRRP
ncbi:MAG TPA: hypothetical protein VNN17_05215 [Terriglobia bacterium]|nr:hypothetical protein [Terriglobia bacterium]